MHRRWILALALLALPCRDMSAGVNRWTSNGPEGGSVSVFVIDAQHPSTLYANAGGSVYKSTDAGATWVPLPVLGAHALAISQSNPNVLYTDRFKSVDGGAHWTPIAPIFGPSFDVTFASAIAQLAVDPSNPDIVFAGFNAHTDIQLGASHAGVMKSSDGGATWAEGLEVSGPSDFPGVGPGFVSLAVDPAEPSKLYAAIFKYPDTLIYASANGGAYPWKAGATPPSRVLNLAVSASGAVYAGSYDGILKSSDGAASWQTAKVGLPADALAYVSVDPTNASVVYAATSAGLFRSTDAAATWELVDPARGPGFLAVDPATPTTLYIWGDGVIKSTDGGVTWAPRVAGIHAVRMVSAAVDPSNPSTVYAGGQGEVAKSTDAGQSWSEHLTNDPYASISDLLVDPQDSQVVLGAAGTAVLMRSGDAGSTWQAVTAGLPAPPLSVNSIAADAQTRGVFYLGTSAGVLKSTNHGAAWSVSGSPKPYVYEVRTDPERAGIVWAATQDGLFQSTDAGASWALAAFDGSAVTALAVDSSSVWAYPLGRLERSIAGGSWIDAGFGLTSFVSPPILVDPTNPSVAYASTTQGVFQTRTGGAGWGPMMNGLVLEQQSFRGPGLAIDPTGRHLYAAAISVSAFETSNRVTLPAAASLHGIPPTYFHSDVSVFNTSSTQPAEVTATYRCFNGGCNPVRTLTIPPRSTAPLDDIVAGLFATPETGGAVEFDSTEPIVVTSRLYTPERPAPTLGMFVPGLRPEQAYPRSALTSLSHSADLTRGSRTNIGLYNPGDEPQDVQVSLFDPAGVALGQIAKFLGPRQALQINDGDIAPVLGGTGDVASFYAVVEGDR
ncbi:MAG: hypothetical protein ABI968_14570, partial [Acidobacteriota bacterium]